VSLDSLCAETSRRDDKIYVYNHGSPDDFDDSVLFQSEINRRKSECILSSVIIYILIYRLYVDYICRLVQSAIKNLNFNLTSLLADFSQL